MFDVYKYSLFGYANGKSVGGGHKPIKILDSFNLVMMGLMLTKQYTHKKLTNKGQLPFSGMVCWV